MTNGGALYARVCRDALPFLILAFTAVTLAAGPVIPDSHTVILDRFNQSTGGTSHGTPAYVQGPTGLQEAIACRSGSYIQYGLIPALESQGTSEMWLRPDADERAGLINFNWATTGSYPAAGHVLHLVRDVTGQLEIGGWAWNAANMYALTSAEVVPTGAWAHIALSWSSSGAKLYVNGMVSASSNQPWLPASPTWGYLNYWGDATIGAVDELHISNIQRTDAEIGAHASLNPVPEAGAWALLSIGCAGLFCARRGIWSGRTTNTGGFANTHLQLTGYASMPLVPIISEFWEGEVKKIMRVLAVVFVAVAVPSIAAGAVLTFDGLVDGDAVTTQFPGIVFSNASVLTAGVSLNEFEFPPRSGSNVVSDTDGPIGITFLSPINSFGGYFTYVTPLTIRAFDAGDNEIASAPTRFSSNLGLSGDAGSSPNELLQVMFAGGISRVLIAGDAAGGSFTLDDATIGAVPEPGTWGLLLTGIALLLVLRRPR